MSLPLVAMYALTVLIGIGSYACSRGPDGQVMGFFWIFGALTLVYVALAWITRHQPIWPHIGAQLILFWGVSALAMMPKPHLEEMAGMIYMFVPAACAGMILLASIVRLIGRWV